MKLISMTDFVLEQLILFKQEKISVYDFSFRVEQMAIFLKQPLNLGMFVPCVDNEFLEEPKTEYEPISFWNAGEVDEKHNDLILEYQSAKERVLFEDVYGIEYIENIILDRCNTIEDLLSLKIVSFELTKSAQKQLGL